MNEPNSVKDSVCGMMVDPHQNEIVYLQMHFAFCSLQCKERFLANPHLYIGYPGHPAPKVEQGELLKRRRVHLALPLPPEAAQRVTEGLQGMMGVKAIHAEGDVIEITYDLFEVSAEQIERAVIAIGVQLGEGWPERLVRAFVHESEEWELASLEAAPPPGPRRGSHER